MIVDPTRVCELLVGLGEVTVLGAVDGPGGPLKVHVETRDGRPGCRGCGGGVWAKDQRPVELVDLAAFGRPARLVWHKRRWTCPTRSCAVATFTEEAPWIAAPRLVMTDRAGRWVTEPSPRLPREIRSACDVRCHRWPFVGFLFRSWPLRKLYVEVPGYNACGVWGGNPTIFTEEGRLRENEFQLNQWWDLVLLTLDRSSGSNWLDPWRTWTGFPKAGDAPALAGQLSW